MSRCCPIPNLREPPGTCRRAVLESLDQTLSLWGAGRHQLRRHGRRAGPDALSRHDRIQSCYAGCFQQELGHSVKEYNTMSSNNVIKHDAFMYFVCVNENIHDPYLKTYCSIQSHSNHFSTFSTLYAHKMQIIIIWYDVPWASTWEQAS